MYIWHRLLLGILIVLTSSGGWARETPQTIALIILDDLDVPSYKHLRQIGALPNMDAIAKRGLSFENAFTQYPLCSPSHATLLTGLSPLRTQVFNNTGASGGYRAFQENNLEKETIATLLTEGGFETAQFGKLLNGALDYAPRKIGTPMSGWTYSLVTGPEYRDYAVVENGMSWVESRYHTDFILGEVVAYLEGVTSDSSTFVRIGFNAPHSGVGMAPTQNRRFAKLSWPRGPQVGVRIDDPPGWLAIEPYDSSLEDEYLHEAERHYRDRAESLASADAAIGRIYELLEKTWKEVGRSYCMFVTSDHGFHQVARGDRFGKLTPYDDDTRVPLIMFCRGHDLPTAEVREEIVLLTDIAPTIAELAGISVSTEGFDGRSILPLLKDPTLPSRSQFLILRRFCEENSGVPACRFDALRTKDGLLCVKHHNGDRELYTDTFQIHNIATTAPPEVIADCDERISKLVTCRGEVCASIENGFAPPSQ